MRALGWLRMAAALVWMMARFAWRRRCASSEHASRPRDLADAELVYMERSFRVAQPFALVAKVDRVYRQPSGALVLVELKTRGVDCVYPTDIIQLSAQRLAVVGQTGLAVEPFAFLCIERPGGRLCSHRVQLLSPAELVALWERRMSLLSGHDRPGYAANRRVCETCAWRSRCDR